MAQYLANLVRVASATTGTGTLTLGSAFTGFLTPSQAGMLNATTYAYAIEADYVTVGDDLVPTSREVGQGTYTSAGGTLTRTVYNSTNGNAALNLTGDEQVAISPNALSFGPFVFSVTAGVTDKAIVRWASAGGDVVQNSAVIVDDSGRLILGTSSSLSVGGNADQLQNWGSSAATGGLTLGMSSTTAATGAHIDFYRSHDAAIGTATVVADGDTLGTINFYGAQQTGTFATQNSAAQIRVDVDGAVTSGAGADMPGRIMFLTTPDGGGTPIERLRFTSTGKLFFNTGNDSNAFSDQNVAGFSSGVQIKNTFQDNSSFMIGVWANSASGPRIMFGKSRNGTIGSRTVVQNGDILGELNFCGDDGVDLDSVGAWIRAVIDGTPGSNDLPTMFQFSTTPDGFSSPSESFRINNAGACYFPRVGTTAGGGSGARLDNATSPANSLLRDTSSLRYKTAVCDLPAERIRALERLRPIEFNSLASADDPNARFVGYAAEEVAAIDPVLVAYDAEGRPDSVMYDRVNLLCIEALKARIASLEQQIERMR